MEPVKTVEGGVTVLMRDDIDTDQIIPARYMKRVERTGFGEYLFADIGREGRLRRAAPTRSWSPA